MENELTQCLKTTWGHESFRPYQLEVIQASLAGKDAFVLMSTGSGKSVCYQLPAVIRRKGQSIGPVTIVVSPLISLMEDQVLSMHNNDITACLVGGSDYSNESRAMAGEFALVFVTPERVTAWTHALQAMARGPGLAMFAVDESHCVSEWGHDFRPSYLQLRSLRTTFPKVPIMALTATATPHVEQEIINNLGLRNPFVAKTSFNRSNLHYSVKIVSFHSKEQEVSNLLQGLDGSAIIYVMTKKEAETLADYLSRVVGSKGARAYHGGMTHGQRRTVHHAFIRDELQVVVATLAFGMGIDKPDVRLVIHSGMPKTVESYYQQTGRAGRDGLPAKCVLLFSRADAVKQKTIMGMSTNGAPTQPAVIARDLKLLAAMEKFATASGCRRKALLGYFGEDMGDATCEGCDVCDRAASARGASSANGIAKSKEDVELFTEPARLMLQAVQDSGGRFGFAVPISLLLGTKKAQDRVYNAKTKPSFGKGKEQRGRGESFWKALFHQLLEREEYLEGVSFTRDSGGRGRGRGRGLGSGLTYRLTPLGRTFLSNPQAKLPTSFIPSEELAMEGKRVKANHREAVVGPQGPGMGLSEDEQRVYSLLHKLREDIAAQYELPPYNVLGAQVLRQLAVRRPVNLTNLHTVDGMSEKKVADYGAKIISVISGACDEFKLSSNVPAKPSTKPETSWLSPITDTKPLSNAQLTLYEAYLREDSLTLEQLATSRPRPIVVSTAFGYLAACMEGGKPFPWDRRRLSIDPGLETQILGVVEHLKAQGHDPHSVGFSLRSVFEELPPGTDKAAYGVIKLMLARLRFENAGGRLPGSRGVVLTMKPSTSLTARKKRTLPSWGGTDNQAKKVSPASKPPPASTGIFVPSYMPLSEAGKADAAVEEVDKAASADIFSPKYAGKKKAKHCGMANPYVKQKIPTSKPWTVELALRTIQKAGPNGVSLKTMAATNPGHDESLRTVLTALQADYALYTKPAAGGELMYLAL